MRKKEIEQHIMDVDTNHGKILSDQDKRIADLEYKVEYLTQLIEKNIPNVNHPASSIMDEVNKQRHEHMKSRPRNLTDFVGVQPVSRFNVPCVVTGPEGEGK